MPRLCPWCETPTETPMVDIGVGEIPCGPEACPACGAWAACMLDAAEVAGMDVAERERGWHHGTEEDDPP